MPRNSQGVYSLPAGNPVIPGTLIETTWANPTMSDVAAALTESVARDGSGAMNGPLILSTDPITLSRQATSKAYVDQFIVSATGLPVGSIVPYAGNTPPPGFVRCDGQAINRTTYAALFTIIGTIYGAGNNVDTFNVPDLRSEFIRGRSDARTVGSKQAASFAAHNHGISDPGHAHAASGSQTAHDHTITTGGHGHGVNDPGHSHSFAAGPSDGGGTVAWASANAATRSVNASGTGISIAAVGDLGGSADARQPAVGVSVDAAVTGIGTGVAGGDETVPQNMALDYCIKALVDSPVAPTVVVGLYSSDDQMISIDSSTPTLPILDIHSNVAFGTVKLDSNNKIPQNLVEISTFQYLGPWDASGGQTPSQALPTEVFFNGDLYQISVGGTLSLRNAAGALVSTVVVSTDQIAFITGSTVGLTEGWYFQPTTAVSGVTANAVGFTPTGTVSATNVQAAIAEVAAEATPLAHVGAGGTQHANVVAAGAAGFMTGTDKTKLDGIAAGAQVNTVGSVNTKTGAVVLTAADVGALTQSGADALYVNVSGDTMSGQLKGITPVDASDLTRKDYVDNLSGVGQSWQTLTGSRALGTSYTNSTGRPIQIAVGLTNQLASGFFGLDMYVSNVQVAAPVQAAAFAGLTVAAVVTVPAGAAYEVDATGIANAALLYWAELR